MQTATDKLAPDTVDQKLEVLKSGIAGIRAAEQELIKNRAERMTVVRREMIQRGEASEEKHQRRLRELAQEYRQAVESEETRKLERADQDKQTVKDLTGLIDSHKGLIAQANTASQGMRAALSLRATHDAQTTKEFQDALLATADSRAGCVFSADVMRGLEGARTRAAQAAAGGIQGALPGPATSVGRP